MSATGAEPTDNLPAIEKQINTNESAGTEASTNTESTKKSDPNTLNYTNDGKEAIGTIRISSDENKDSSMEKDDPLNNITHANGQNLDTEKTTTGNYIELFL